MFMEKLDPIIECQIQEERCQIVATQAFRGFVTKMEKAEGNRFIGIDLGIMKCRSLMKNNRNSSITGRIIVMAYIS